MDIGTTVGTGLPRNGMTHGFLSTIGLIKRATQYFEQVAEEIRMMVGD